MGAEGSRPVSIGSPPPGGRVRPWGQEDQRDTLEGAPCVWGVVRESLPTSPPPPASLE